MMDAAVSPSPFIAGTRIQFAWDSTSLGYLKTCPRLYYYHMIEGWQSKDESIHLRFGIELHTALQSYDILRAEGATHNDALHQITRDLLIRTADYPSVSPDDKPSIRYKTRAALTRTVIWYLEHYKDDAAQTHILSDGKAAVELSFRFELDYTPEDQTVPYVLCGHLDRVVRFQDELFVMDYKTTTTTPGSYYFAQYEPHNQMSLYTLATQIVLDAPVRGVIINAIQILAEDSRFVRGFTYRTADQLNEWQTDLQNWLTLAQHYAETDYWPQNDTACDKFGGCRFRNICSKSPGVRKQFLKSEFTQGEPWNPLRVR